MMDFSALDQEDRYKYYALVDNIEQTEREIEHYSKRGKSIMEESNMGRRFKSRTFETFNRELFPQAYDFVKTYAEKFEENKGEGLLLTGNPGTGKTHLAAAAANYVITQFGIPVKFGGFVEILENIKRTFGTPDDIARQLIDMPLLVIDDLGKERQSEWSNSILYRVVNGRYENYAPIIITTNERMDDLKRNIGEATFSRIVEMCDGVLMNGSDYRMRKLPK